MNPCERRPILANVHACSGPVFQFRPTLTIPVWHCFVRTVIEIQYAYLDTFANVFVVVKLT